MTSKKTMSELPSQFKRISAIIGLIGGIIALILGAWQIINQVRTSREIRDKINIHLSVGDRFATQMEYDMAIKEYQEAIDLDKTEIAAHLKIITAMRDKLLRAAFASSSGCQIGLAINGTYATGVSESEVNAALSNLYRFQANKPALQDDVGLLLDEALIMKTNDNRSREAIKVLEKAHKLSPENHEVLAELGLLQEFHSDTLKQKIDGVNLIRNAIDLRPDYARYHYYLAQSLVRTYGCIWEIEPEGAVACAEAIREYHRAADLATTQDIWGIRYSSLRGLMAIFETYEYGEDILTNNLRMPLDERIKELEYLIAPKNFAIHTRPDRLKVRFMLAILYYATGNTEKAELIILEVFKDDRSCVSYPQWLELYEKMEKSGHNSTTFNEIREIVNKSM
ncbi:hypothetical protein [Desulforhopalus sp. IMCC35007]|uniref:hypothetical protein n=1 Tax=Desulforhopalus sp. IMCC35007 TaxID=2569543 RepID=UPI0010AE10C6|nr:hypothetical protein [Desulforhopalus sp. IMCC35007]TKB06099.1 hypothetical protein FCL48_22235 [Desulforhopalus sp. IMCC35007]